MAAVDDEEEVPEDFAPAIVAESTMALKTMSVASAVVELDTKDSPVYVFRNAGNDNVNIVYRRPDGNIGWIDPSDGSTARTRTPGRPAGAGPAATRTAKEKSMDLSDLIEASAVMPALKANSKKQLLQVLAEKAAGITGLPEREIFDTILQRERLGSTGVGNGIAIPHGKLAGVKRDHRHFRAAGNACRFRGAGRPAGRPAVPAAGARRRRRRSSEGVVAHRARAARPRNGRENPRHAGRQRIHALLSKTPTSHAA